jgi:hypothetical protein
MEKPELVGKLLEMMAKDERPDSLEISTPSKGGGIKVYGDFRGLATSSKRHEPAIQCFSLMNDANC